MPAGASGGLRPSSGLRKYVTEIVVGGGRKWSKRDQRFFDLEHPEFGRSHPNWRAKPVARAYSYVTKDGDYVTEGEVPQRLLPAAERSLGKRDAAFAALDAQHDSVESFMSAVRRHHPYEYFTKGTQIEANVRKAKGVSFNYTPAYEPGSFTIPGAVQDWLDTEFNQEVSSQVCSWRA